jgi:HAD superfamily hydrolase (TIGR01509 family)
MTTTVVFDLGGVLCRFDPGARIHALAEASGLPDAVVRDEIWGSGRDAASDRGELTEDEAFALASLDGRLDRATILRCWARAFAPNEEVLAIADRLPERPALLTNNGAVVEALFAGVLAPVAERCAPVLLSWRLRATKPSREVFDRAAVACSRRADELVMVDDAERNVVGARAAGWDSIRFTDAPTLAAELRARGVTSG